MKVKCQASCSKCYHEKGRTQEYDANDLIWFCTSCKKNFLCEIGVAQGMDHEGKVFYSCNICGKPLIKEEVDKSIITKRTIPGKRPETEDLYHSLMGSKEKGKTKKRWWKKTGKPTTALSSYEQSQISELCDVEGLTIPLTLEFARDLKIQNLNNYHGNKKICDLLTRLAHEDPSFISFLFSSLIQLDSKPRAFELRFAVFCSSHISGKIEVTTSQHLSRDKVCDFKIIKPSGEETWVYCLEKDMDINNLEKLAKRVFDVNFNEFPNLKRVFLAAKSFSYLAKGLLSKYQTVLTGMDTPSIESSQEMWESVPLLLWQPIPGKIKFQNVSLE
ncbi:MAG: hypothetical protein JSW11_09505 [Candidatus Heimdallarchaeota archaeon]|nr:MAG: hypothetical protein JSW11_09505 [Candidatus Heimdallarchaeota archaeon]